MKLITALALPLLGLLAVAQATESGRKKYLPGFVESLQKLRRGPPNIVGKRNGMVESKWITQKLDHFDETNNRTWQMRYLANEEYFENGGPMFIYIGGEWEIKPNHILQGLFTDLAKEHKAILFYTEHRYYGESQPTRERSTDSYQYLNVKQALADLAHFINFQRQTDSRLANSKTIVGGCSYAATMVVWSRVLYPELINGGWASSAPLLAKVDFKEYHEMTGRTLENLGSPECYYRVQSGINELEAMFENNRSAEATAILKLCDSFDPKNDLDLWSLFSTISNTFAGIVQYQKGSDIHELCDNLMSFEDNTTAIASLIASKEECTDVTYNSSLEYFMNDMDDGITWYYQTCNEFGWYQSSTSQDQPFGTKIPVTLFTQLCFDSFNPHYTEKHIQELVDETNEYFGGIDVQVKNVHMSHGGADPWSSIGHNATYGAWVIPRASHCADMDSIRNSDSPEMRASKQRLVELVREWLV